MCISTPFKLAPGVQTLQARTHSAEVVQDHLIANQTGHYDNQFVLNTLSKAQGSVVGRRVEKAVTE